MEALIIVLTFVGCYGIFMAGTYLLARLVFPFEDTSKVKEKQVATTTVMKAKRYTPPSTAHLRSRRLARI